MTSHAEGLEEEILNYIFDIIRRWTQIIPKENL
jgi:hypothetical protein